VYTFGKGASGQLGHGNRNDCNRPTKVRRLVRKKDKIRFVGAGFNQTFCVSTEGKVYSFGKAGPWLGYGTTSSFDMSLCSLSLTPSVLVCTLHVQTFGRL